MVLLKAVNVVIGCGEELNKGEKQPKLSVVDPSLEIQPFGGGDHRVGRRFGRGWISSSR